VESNVRVCEPGELLAQDGVGRREVRGESDECCCGRVADECAEVVDLAEERLWRGVGKAEGRERETGPSA